MSELISIFRTVFNVLKQPSGLASIIFDILIITIVLYKVLEWTRETRAYQVMKGIGLLFAVSVLARLFGLTTISWILDSILASGTIFLILFILFTPELRRVLERIGSHRISKLGVISDETDTRRLIQDLKRSIMRLAKRRVGALLVFERKSGLGDIAATGVTLDAALSGALIENIFEPNTPLHDGAVLIRGTTIVAASCLLPLSDDTKVSRELGTRHRAAIGVSAAADCVVIVVSEETGAISVAREGKLIRYLDEKALTNTLDGLLAKDQTFVLPWLRRKKEA
ncbi:MAG: diadenylate cyclase CdaA [Clostridia bacterium]|nr:diadenylate cyclase CdaA [Clostridia bacterium]MBR0437183.1 diadenylate cyclase CdaA [Clostridia bacterium]MBR2644343.1 diadenylate cyclase CdaA [Clostridia bacterium]MBR3037352.1 diadenylate cyclase CdaA [Clostridia bacterium]